MSEQCAREELNILLENLKSQDEEIRRKAVAGLVHHPLSATKELLFRSMGDESWRVRKEAVDVFLPKADSETVVIDLVNLLRSHDNAGLRNSAVEAFTRLGRRSTSVLVRFAKDPDHDVRKFLIDIMGTIGDPLSVPVLLDALNDGDANVCAAAAENLGRIGEASAVPKLVQALSTSDTWLRFTILEALGRIGEAVPLALIAPLAENNVLKKAVYECVGAIGQVDAIPLLIEGLKARQKNAREAAAIAIIRIRELLAPEAATKEIDAPLGLFKGSPFVDGLVALLESSDSSIREAVVKILALIGDERTTGELIKGCRDEKVRRFCLQSFKEMGSGTINALVSAFNSAGVEERCFIAYLCGEIGFKGGIAMLKDGMRAPFPMLRRASVLAAGKLEHVDAIDEIASLLDDESSDVRDGAVQALAGFAKTQPATVSKIAQRYLLALDPHKRKSAALLLVAMGEADRLSLLLKDESADVRRVAVDGLASLGIHAAGKHLVMALADEDPEVRVAAAGALGQIGGDEAISSLELAVKDEDPWVRGAAVKALARVGGDRAMAAVLSVSANADGMLMLSVLEAMDSLGGQKALELVKTALAHSDEEVVKLAIEILARHDDTWIDTYRDKLLGHSHWDVRNSFIRALVARRGTKAVPHLREALQHEGDDMVRALIQEQLDRLQ